MAPRSEEEKRQLVASLLVSHIRGDIDATYKLGMAYWKGEGIEQDKHEAVHLWQVAASGAHAKAQCELGTCYLLGMVVDRDEAETTTHLAKYTPHAGQSAPWRPSLRQHATTWKRSEAGKNRSEHSPHGTLRAEYPNPIAHDDGDAQPRRAGGVGRSA